MQLQLVSPERTLVDEQVDEVQVPGLTGYLGVLPGHAPLLSELMPGGVLSYKTGGSEKVIAVFGGFVEISDDRIRVLADAAERREDINVDQARAELSKATDPADIARAQAKIDAVSK